MTTTSKTIIVTLICSLMVCPAGALDNSTKERKPAEPNNAKALVPDEGVCDTHIHIFNGKAYMYAGHDNVPNYIGNMTEWRIYSSDDLVDWKLERVIRPEETYLGKGSIKCYATDAAFRNGKYYFYYSNGKDHTSGVLVGDSPTGPFTDPLNGEKLLPEDLTPSDAHHDPAIFIEDDGTPYIIFGRSKTESWYAARLNEDMISLAEKPRPIGRKGYNSDQPFVFKRNGIYYLSFTSGRYITSDSLFGEYSVTKYGGNVGGHGSYFTWHNQWYRSANNTDVGGKYYRKAIMTYVHFKDNGDIVHDRAFYRKGYAESFGVGQYNAEWPKIEAEWFFRSEGTEKAHIADELFEIREIHSGDRLYYPNIHNLEENATITFHISSMTKGKIEIRENDAEGRILGTCRIRPTGAWDNYMDISCRIKNKAGKTGLCFVFKGGKGEELVHFDWFTVTRGKK